MLTFKPTTAAGIAACILFCIALAIFAPLGTIWAINALFGLAIPFSFKTWCASILLFGVLRGGK